MCFITIWHQQHGKMPDVIIYACVFCIPQGEANRRYNYIKYSDGRIAGNARAVCHGRLRVKY